jgi:flavin reductase
VALVTRNEFRDAMARVCAPVNIVTTDGPAGRGGFTATAVCAVSDDPPMLLVCMNGRSAQCGMFLTNGRFCVNVLTHEHAHLAGKFAGESQDMAERYSAARWVKMESGTPALANAIVNFDCEIDMVHSVATHHVIFARVREVRTTSDGRPLLYLDRNYRDIQSNPGSFGG